MNNFKELIPYTAKNGKQPVIEWLKTLDKPTRSKITARFAKIEAGNFGNCKTVGAEIKELKYYFGSGYRIYFAEDGDKLVILLIGGDKSTQSKDIKKANEFWNDSNLIRRLNNMTYNTINEYIVENLKNDEEAKEYLLAALEDYFEEPDSNALAIALKNLILAKGSVTQFAKEANINRQHLYKIFNKHSKPQMDTLHQIVKALGFKIVFNIQKIA